MDRKSGMTFRPLGDLSPRAAASALCMALGLCTAAACDDADSHGDAGTDGADADLLEDPGPDPAEMEQAPDGTEDGIEDPGDISDDADDGGDGFVQEEILPGIFTFAATARSLPDDDLAVIDAMIGDARLIGLGESVHTSGGYYAMKSRLIRHAVEALGVRVFAMEIPRTAARVVDDFMRTCEGDAVTALLHGIFGVFADTNTAALVDWLCGYNADHPDDMVRFYGFDAQQSWDDGQEIEAFLNAAAPADAEALTAGIDVCRIEMEECYDLSDWTVLPYPEDEFLACLAGIDVLDAYLETNEADLAAATSDEALALARIASLSLRSWQGEQHYYESDIGQSLELRDVAMHRIFDGLRRLYFPESRVVIWAHNFHLETDHPAVDDPDLPGNSTFGTELYRQVGDDYAAVALIGYEVEINWSGYDQPPLPGPDFLETRLHGLGEPYLIVDFDSPWLGEDAAYQLDFLGTLVPRQQFRLGLYLDYSPAMRALAW